MSSADVNPYQSGYMEPQKSEGTVKRPTGLLIFCVLILAFASLGLLGNVVGGVMLAMGGGKVDYKQQFGSQPNVEVNKEALAKLQGYGSIHGARNLGLLIAGVVVAFLLIVGSIASIYPFRWGAALLTISCLAAILFCVGQGIVMMMNMQDIVTVIKDYPDDFLIPEGDMDERAVEIMNSVMRITYTVIPIVTWVINGAKAVFYVAVILYLRKSNVRQFIQGTATA
jgi:hypothetical protein